MSSPETRAALMEATVRLASTAGVRAVTARAVATEAGVNQALVFYHFGGVDGLLREAFATATQAAVEQYAEELARATTFAELHAVGVRLAEDSKANHQAALLSHVISAAHTDPQQAAMLRTSLLLWREAVGDAVRRVLAKHGVHDAVDVDAMTGALAAATVGMITLDAIEDSPLGRTLPSLGGLAALVDRAARFVPAPVLRRVLRSADASL